MGDREMGAKRLEGNSFSRGALQFVVWNFGATWQPSVETNPPQVPGVVCRLNTEWKYSLDKPSVVSLLRTNYECRIVHTQKHTHTDSIHRHARTHTDTIHTHAHTILYPSFSIKQWKDFQHYYTSLSRSFLHFSLPVPLIDLIWNQYHTPAAFLSLNHLETAAEGREYVSLRFLKMRLWRVEESAGNKIFFSMFLKF